VKWLIATGTPSLKVPRDKSTWTLWFAIGTLRLVLPKVYRDVGLIPGERRGTPI